MFKTPPYLGSRGSWHVSGEKREAKKLKGKHRSDGSVDSEAGRNGVSSSVYAGQ